METFGNEVAVSKETEPSEFELATMAHYATVEAQTERIARALEGIAIFLASVKLPRGFRQ